VLAIALMTAKSIVGLEQKMKVEIKDVSSVIYPSRYETEVVLTDGFGPWF